MGAADDYAGISLLIGIAIGCLLTVGVFVGLGWI